MQSLNLDALVYFPYARFVNPSIAVPHFSVKDIAAIDPWKLKFYGFKGGVFDLDNTLRAPYAKNIFPSISDAFAEYQLVFGRKIAIASNSAGTLDDNNGEEARKIEEELGISVLRHWRKKPGGIGSVISSLHCDPQDLFMVGDRIFTDIVFGNRYGMLTIHTRMLTEEGDNKAAAKVRNYELPLIERWKRKGISAPPHARYHPDICRQQAI